MLYGKWKNKYLKQIARSFNIFRLLNLLFGPKIAKWVKSIILDMSTHKISEINAKTKKMFQGHRGSNHPVKNLTTGEGGSILTNHKAIDKKVKLLRSHGVIKKRNKSPWSYEMQDLGYL